MKIFSKYSKWLLAFTLATTLSLGCAPNDGAPTSVDQRPTVAAQSQSQLHHAIDVQNSHTPDLMTLDGVIGTGTGIGNDGAPVIYIFTSKPSVGHIPSVLDAVPTHVQFVGKVVAYKGGKGGSGGGFKGTYRDPVWSGVSTGNTNECASGTIGCVVVKNNHRYFLSNNHVFARENLASPGEGIVQPGRYDKRCRPSGQVATLSEASTILFGGADNVVDAAIAEINEGIIATSRMAIGSYMPSATTATAAVGMSVKKTGRTTGLTSAAVSAVNVTINVGYSGGTAKFVQQIGINNGGFGNSGDSGSLIVESSSNEPVALLFAGGSGWTFANPINDVLNEFNVAVDPN